MSIFNKAKDYRKRLTQAINQAQKLGDSDTVEDLFEILRQLDDQISRLKTAQKAQKSIEKIVTRMQKRGEDAEDWMFDWAIESDNISFASAEIKRIISSRIPKSKIRNPSRGNKMSFTKAQFVKTVNDFLRNNASPDVKVKKIDKNTFLLTRITPGADDTAHIFLDWFSPGKIGDLKIYTEFTYGILSDDYDAEDLTMYRLDSQEKLDRDLKYILQDFLHDYGNFLVKRRMNPGKAAAVLGAVAFGAVITSAIKK